jgi:hypothetical protein
MKNRIACSVALLSLLLISTDAVAGGSPRAHDGGFLLRMTLGGGQARTSITSDVADVELSGDAGEFTIAVGGIVRENLALHGTLFFFSIQDPDVKLNQLAGRAAGSVGCSGIGGGFTWWLMPANLYLSSSAGIGVLTADPDGLPSSSSDAGFDMEVAVGKEWFVSDRWGLGLGGAYSYHRIPDGGVDSHWSGHSFALRFSATFN